MNLRKKLIAKELKEALGGGETSVASSAGVLRYKDNPLVQEVQKLMKDKFKDVTLEFIHENGDIWEIGFRFEIEDPSPQMQYSREMAKQRSYEIKRELEIYLMPKFAIPSFSIQGVKTVRAEDKVFCEFAISLIYANKGNLKVNYEAYKKKVNALLEAELKPREESLDEISDESNNLKQNINDNALYTIYFVTVMHPDSEDAEGWTSEGISDEDAWKKLKNHLETKEGYRGNYLKFYKVQVQKAKEKYQDVPPFTQIQ